MKTLSFSVLVIIICACKSQPTKDLKAIAEQQILQTENDFAKMAAEKGIKEAFLFYAADSAVILRGNKIFEGKVAIEEFLGSQDNDGVSLVWNPDFIEASISGDLGYTFGKYTYTLADSLGMGVEAEGIFHTVWKRQHDGSWKFIWD